MSVATARTTDELSLSQLAEVDQRVRDALEQYPTAGGEVYIDSLDPSATERPEDGYLIVSTTRELVDAAGSGTDIWIADGAEIDVAGHTLHFRDQKVGSSRGIGGSEGGLIYSSEKGSNTHAWSQGDGTGHIHLHGDSHFFGLRYRGDCLDWDAEAHPGYVPYPSGDRSARDRVYNANRGRGIKVHDSEVTISNIELWGWGAQGIQMGSRSSSPISPHIHHIYGHDCMMTSAGYIVDALRGVPVIEDSYLNAARHALCTFGYYDSGWVARRCVFGPSTSSHVLDAHGLHNNVSSSASWLDNPSNPNSPDWIRRASGNMLAEECTFLMTHVIPDATFDGGRPTWAASFRGVPWPHDGDGAVIRRCAFVHDGPQSRNYGSRSFSNPAAVNQQVHSDVPNSLIGSDGFTRNVRLEDNRYGIGFLPDYDGVHGAPVDIANPERTVLRDESPRLARHDPHAQSRGRALREVEAGLLKLALTTPDSDNDSTRN